MKRGRRVSGRTGLRFRLGVRSHGLFRGGGVGVRVGGGSTPI